METNTPPHVAGPTPVQDGPQPNGAAAPGDGQHIAVLDGVRAMSILLVLAGHLLPLGPKNLQLNALSATGGMSLFFVLSGFLICSFLLAGIPVRDFLIKRLTRIVPAATVYIVVIFLIIDFRPMHALVTGLYLNNYLTGYATGLSGHLWSLCVEMHFYAAAALIAMLFGKRGLWLFPVLALIVTALRVATGETFSIKTHLRVDEILAGATLALVYRGYFGALPQVRSLPALLPLLLAFWAVTVHLASGPLQYFRPYSTALLVGSVLYSGPGLMRTFLESTPMRYIATVSYALYIWHFFAISFGLNEGSSLARYLIKRPISIVLMFALAHASTFYIERPASQFVRRRFLSGGRPAPQPPTGP